MVPPRHLRVNAMGSNRATSKPQNEGSAPPVAKIFSRAVNSLASRSENFFAVVARSARFIILNFRRNFFLCRRP
jgi:hypothetical protein